ncbi:MAG: hypothetical protein M9916_12890 [Crocinitomicaceae bacterium]|nr:hypothetical protein [Crocinitomicaceae bacterium]
MKKLNTRIFSIGAFILAFSAGLNAQTYCTPSSEYGCAYQISSVNLAGESATLNNSSTCGEYTFFLLLQNQI